MSALSKNERDGLEDVFLSIHSHNDKYEKIKDLAALIFENESTKKLAELLKQAKYGIKEVKISQFVIKNEQKKKNLSK
jgi:lipase chaperone LimK